MRITQSAINQSNGFLGAGNGCAAPGPGAVLAGLRCQSMPHNHNRFKLLLELANAGLFEDNSASKLSTVPSARWETTRILATAAARFVSVSSLSTNRRTSAIASLSLTAVSSTR